MRRGYTPNVDTEGVIRGLASNGEYFIPIHDFWKIALKGDYNFFEPSKVRAANVFDAFSSDRSEHFLAPITLAYLASEGAHRASEGFVRVDSLLSELQSLGFALRSCQACVRRLINDKLIDSSLRISFEEDEAGLFGVLPDKVRINTTGAYYVHRWICTFSYLDAVAVDTQIFDIDIKEELRSYIKVALIKRPSKAWKLKEYLAEVWEQLNISIDYFDWTTVCASQTWTFDKVNSALLRHA